MVLRPDDFDKLPDDAAIEEELQKRNRDHREQPADSDIPLEPIPDEEDNKKNPDASRSVEISII